MSDSLYTLGIWYAKPGMEDDFVRTWTELATWTKREFEGAVSVVLLRDHAESRRFISVGPWRSQKDINAWRGSEGFRTRVEQLKPLLERFEPGLFEPVFALGA